MADTRTKRGPHPKDAACFEPEQLPLLRAAVDDLSWLLGRGYGAKAAHRLVSDRYALRDRQRQALQRCAISPEVAAQRQRRRLAPADVPAGVGALAIDGYNVLLTVEAAMSGAPILLARDGVLRDLAAMRRQYRKVTTTRPALVAIGELVAGLGFAPVTWLLDQPVANSDRLRDVMLDVAGEQDFSWHVELVPNPDPLLAASDHVVATADGAILDRCRRWLNLARLVVEARVADAWLLEL